MMANASKKNNKKPAVGKPTAGKRTPANGKGAKKKEKWKKPKPKRNASQNIPNGRTLQTRDEYLQDGKGYTKPGKENSGLYRKVVVVDSNKNNELAVVKLTTSEKGQVLTGYKTGKSKYRPYVQTRDDEDNPIKIGQKFHENKPQHNVTRASVNTIKKDLIKKPKNREQLRRLKGRK